MLASKKDKTIVLFFLTQIYISYFPFTVPRVFIEDRKYEIFVDEQNSSVTILRQGGDLTKTCSVWCGSLLTSSEKKNELLNSYYQITFKSFETSAVSHINFSMGIYTLFKQRFQL